MSKITKLNITKNQFWSNRCLKWYRFYSGILCSISYWKAGFSQPSVIYLHRLDIQSRFCDSCELAPCGVLIGFGTTNRRDLIKDIPSWQRVIPEAAQVKRGAIGKRQDWHPGIRLNRIVWNQSNQRLLSLFRHF